MSSFSDHSHASTIRPEKDHAAQLRAFQKLLAVHPEHLEQNVRLVLLGGSRNSADVTRVEGLRRLAKELEIEVCHS
jgi:alpha-1,2-mannosyltransferase